MYENYEILNLIEQVKVNRITKLQKSSLDETEIEWGKFVINDTCDDLKHVFTIETQKRVDDMAREKDIAYRSTIREGEKIGLYKDMLAGRR